MEQRNEPSTAEIVSFLMEMPESTFWSYTRVGKVSHEEIAACIEQLERENAALKSRAEKAEAERDAAKKDIEEIMSSHGLADYTVCKYCARPDDDTCFIPNDKKTCKAEWRGRGKGNNGKSN